MIARILASRTTEKRKLDRKLAAIGLGEGPVLVIGSAPGSRMPIGINERWSTISINASQVRLAEWGLPDPTLTIFRGNILGKGHHQREVWKQLAGRSTGHLLALAATPEERLIAEALPARHYHAGRTTLLSYPEKGAIIQQESGVWSLARSGPSTCSQGVLAIALALRLGADAVVISGFSFGNGHFYRPGKPDRRDHSVGDRLALRRIADAKRPVFASDPEFAQDSGLPIWAGSGDA